MSCTKCPLCIPPILQTQTTCLIAACAIKHKLLELLFLNLEAVITKKVVMMEMGVLHAIIPMFIYI